MHRNGFPHPSCDHHGVVHEGLEVLSDGGESALCTADTDGVVLSDVLSCGQVELVGGDDGSWTDSVPGVDPLDGVSGGVSQEGQDAPCLFGCGHYDLLVVHDVLDLDVESLLGPGIDYESGGGEGFQEDTGQGHGVRGGLGLVRDEEHQGLGSPLLEGHLGGTGSGSLDVSGEGIGEDVLSCGVQLHGLGDLGGLLEALPCGSVDVLVVLSLVVGHEEVDVVSDTGDVEILDVSLLLGIGEDVLCGLHHGGVGSGMADDGSDIGFDN